VPNSEAKQISFPLIKLAKKLKVDGKGKNALLGTNVSIN